MNIETLILMLAVSLTSYIMGFLTFGGLSYIFFLKKVRPFIKGFNRFYRDLLVVLNALSKDMNLEPVTAEENVVTLLNGEPLEDVN